MRLQDQYSTWVEVDLQAIHDNVSYISQATGVQVMAVVKANAYGHGALPVSQAALSAGASWLGVARVEEALELRGAGLAAPILLLGYTPTARYDEVIAQRISLTVWEPSQVELCRAAASRVGQPARVHIKVDTGMSRLGIPARDAADFARLLHASEGVQIEGIFTHFARADEDDQAPSNLQEKQFRTVLQALEAAGIKPGLVHAANSAAALARPSSSFDLVRLGIAMYGLHPSPQRRLPEAFRPALSWRSVLSQVKVLPSGQGVSYGHTYLTSKMERIGTVPVGYVDGFRRTSGNHVLVGGRRVPVVGRVCMDQFMVSLEDVPEAQAGDEVTLIGWQNESHLSAEEVADTWHTINYEVTACIGRRVPRIYEVP